MHLLSLYSMVLKQLYRLRFFLYFIFQVLKAMKAELAASGLSEEEILHKAQMLMKAFGREDSSSMAEFSLASAQKNAALKQNGTSPKDFAQVPMIEQIKIS